MISHVQLEGAAPSNPDDAFDACSWAYKQNAQLPSYRQASNDANSSLSEDMSKFKEMHRQPDAA